MEAPLAQVAISFGSVFAIPGLLNGEATRKPIAHGVCHFLGLWECPRFRKTLWDSCRLLSGVQKHAGIRADRASGREKHSGIRTDRCLEYKNILGFEQIVLLGAPEWFSYLETSGNKRWLGLGSAPPRKISKTTLLKKRCEKKTVQKKSGGVFYIWRPHWPKLLSVLGQYSLFLAF